jgi:hypothetical protein
MDVERDQVVDDLGALRFQLMRAQIAAPGLAQVSELRVGLAEVVMSIRRGRPLLQRPLEAAQRLVQLLCLAVRDAQGVEVQGIAPIELVGTQSVFDRVAGASRADGQACEHVPCFGLARILRQDLPKRVLGSFLVARLQRMDYSLHQARNLW